MLKNLLDGFSDIGEKVSESFGGAVNAVSDGFEAIGNKVSETTKTVSDEVKDVGKKALELKDEVSTNSASVESSDILNVKESLKKVGHYKTPEWGMTNFTDNQMFEGIKSFQKKNGLKVDGVMKPGGETETTLNKKLSFVAPQPESKPIDYSWTTGPIVPQKSELSANEQIIKQLMEGAGMQYQGTIEELKKSGWKSNPNVMSLAGGEGKSGGDSSSGDGDREGFFAGLGEAFSKLGNMIGLGDSEGSKDGSDGGNAVSDALSKMRGKVGEPGKFPTLEANDIKGGFDNIKFEKGNYKPDINDKISLKQFSKIEGDLYKIGQNKKLTSKDISNISEKAGISFEQAKELSQQYSKEFNDDEFDMLNNTKFIFKSAGKIIEDPVSYVSDLVGKNDNLNKSLKNAKDSKEIRDVLNGKIDISSYSKSLFKELAGKLISIYPDTINRIDTAIPIYLKNRKK